MVKSIKVTKKEFYKVINSYPEYSLDIHSDDEVAVYELTCEFPVGYIIKENNVETFFLGGVYNDENN